MQSASHRLWLTGGPHVPHGALLDQPCPALPTSQSLGPVVPGFSWHHIDCLAAAPLVFLTHCWTEVFETLVQTTHFTDEKTEIQRGEKPCPDLTSPYCPIAAHSSCLWDASLPASQSSIPMNVSFFPQYSVLPVLPLPTPQPTHLGLGNSSHALPAFRAFTHAVPSACCAVPLTLHLVGVTSPLTSPRCHLLHEDFLDPPPMLG